MMNLLEISLEARNPLRNHYRSYDIVIGKDLFDNWVVVLRFARIGNKGREVTYSSADFDQVARIVRRTLNRRRTARQRIGCDYLPCRIQVDPFLPSSAWLEEIKVRGREAAAQFRPVE